MIGVFQNFVKQAACFFFMAGYKQCPYASECTTVKAEVGNPKRLCCYSDISPL